MKNNSRLREFFASSAPSAVKLALVAMILVPSRAAAQADVAFTLRDAKLIPEGIAYDPASRAFFVGSTFHRKIVRYDASGVESDYTRPAQDGLLGLIGMKVHDGVLWAASGHAGANLPMEKMDDAREGASALHAYDIATGRLLKVFRLAPSALDAGHFLNDLAITGSGDVFVTDMVGHVLYRASMRDAALEPVVRLGDEWPNGIALAPDDEHAYVAIQGGFLRVDLRARTYERVELADGVTVGGADGLYLHDNTLIAIEPGRKGEEISRYTLDATGRKILARETLFGGHPELEQPTTGVIVGDEFYFIANSHLQTFRRFMAGESRSAKLEGTRVMRLRLK